MSSSLKSPYDYYKLNKKYIEKLYNLLENKKSKKINNFELVLRELRRKKFSRNNDFKKLQLGFDKEIQKINFDINDSIKSVNLPNNIKEIINNLKKTISKGEELGILKKPEEFGGFNYSPFCDEEKIRVTNFYKPKKGE